VTTTDRECSPGAAFGGVWQVFMLLAVAVVSVLAMLMVPVVQLRVGTLPLWVHNPGSSGHDDGPWLRKHGMDVACAT
jgi:hypothetical protein